MFANSASRILTIANSTYSTNGFFSLEEWFTCRELLLSRKDLAEMDKENRRKSSTTLG